MHYYPEQSSYNLSSKCCCFDITKRDFYNSVGNADPDSGSDSESESEKVGSPAKIAKVLG